MITKTVEGLIIQRNEIFSVVLNYMENAYKYTKYKIAIKSSENGSWQVRENIFSFMRTGFFLRETKNGVLHRELK